MVTDHPAGKVTQTRYTVLVTVAGFEDKIRAEQLESIMLNLFGSICPPDLTLATSIVQLQITG